MEVRQDHGACSSRVRLLVQVGRLNVTESKVRFPSAFEHISGRMLEYFAILAVFSSGTRVTRIDKNRNAGVCEVPLPGEWPEARFAACCASDS
jgi:hypothetical protein